jgi:hypothetical protein
MRKIRSCAGNTLATGQSGCQIDFGKIKAVILVPHGQKLGENITKGSLGEKCHADLPNRIYPIKTIVEYAKNGGEPQVSAVGYGGNGVTGISAQTDTFTVDKFSEHLAASLSKNMNKRFDAYYVDENNLLIGINDGTDILAGIPMSTVYPNVTPHPTSSAKATLTVSCCLEDARAAVENFDYVQLDFNPMDELTGLVSVDVIRTEAHKYKIVETIGGYDRTAEFGTAIATAGTTVCEGGTAISYDSANNVLNFTETENVTTGLVLKAASVLYTNHIVGIEYNRTLGVESLQPSGEHT